MVGTASRKLNDRFRVQSVEAIKSNPRWLIEFFCASKTRRLENRDMQDGRPKDGVSNAHHQLY